MQYQGKGQFEKLKIKIKEFVNLVTGSKSPDAMEKGRIEGREEEAFEEGGGEGGEEQFGLGGSWEEWGGMEGVNGVGELCYNFCKPGHYARECQSSPGKGKAKGKGAGGDFFRGKGKGSVQQWQGQQYGKAGGKKGMKGKKGGAANGGVPMYGGCYTCGEAHFQANCP